MALKRGSGAPGLRNNKLIFAAIASVLVLTFLGSLFYLKSFTQTETYYVLSADVPTRTQVTPDMLTPITTSEKSGPPNAKTIADVQAGDLFTKYPLKAGDILSASNVGAFDDIATGIPDSWIITSFGVSADNAIGGRIKRGDYADMMVATPDGTFYPFVNMLVLDTSISLSGASSADAVNTAEAKAGQTSQYTVGGTPGDIGRLQQVMKKYGPNVKLTLSPRQNQYAPPRLADYSDQGDMFKFDPKAGPKNLGENTDYTFTPLKRDAFGRPIEDKSRDCGKGNGKVAPEVCAQNGQQQGTTATASPTTSAAQ